MGSIQRISLVLSQNDILNLSTISKVLVPAPGDGLTVVLHRIFLFYTFGGVAFIGGSLLQGLYQGGAVQLFTQGTGTILSPNSVFQPLAPIAAGAPPASSQGLAVIVNVNGANFTVGAPAATLKIIAYHTLENYQGI